MKEWYLTRRVPDICGGYESDAIAQYAQSNFTDILETDFATEVTLYDHALNQIGSVRCVIQGTTADTYLQSMKRTILFPIGTVKTGMYVFCDNTYWLIDGYPGNNKSYEKVNAAICQYKLRFQNREHQIVERWVNLTSASKYDVGENEYKNIILSSNNYTILCPYDEDTIQLDGQRVFIDISDVPVKVFKITRDDDVLYSFGEHGAMLSFIADKEELNPLTDNQELRLCDYIDPDTPTSSDEPNPDTPISITGSTSLPIGRIKTYRLSNFSGDSDTIHWDIQADEFKVYVVGTDENSIKLQVSEDQAIGNSFLLTASAEGQLYQLEIEITEGL